MDEATKLVVKENARASGQVTHLRTLRTGGLWKVPEDYLLESQME